MEWMKCVDFKVVVDELHPYGIPRYLSHLMEASMELHLNSK